VAGTLDNAGTVVSQGASGSDRIQGSVRNAGTLQIDRT
jgi:hypothetical protein